jgi:hypothetical protein
MKDTKNLGTDSQIDLKRSIEVEKSDEQKEMTDEQIETIASDISKD